MANSVDPLRLDQNAYPIQLEIATQYGDMDVMGHLNNVSIARYYESARARFHLKMYGRNIFAEALPAIVLVESKIRYLKEGFYPDPVVVGTAVARIGNTSYGLYQSLFQNDECIGVCDTVFVYLQDRQPTALPMDARKSFSNKMFIKSS